VNVRHLAVTDVAAALLLVVGAVAAVAAPPDRLQGDLQRLMYLHVPAAWLAYLAFAVTLAGSVLWLRTRRPRWDRLAAASAELGVVFTGLALALGSIWGKPVWGVWWTWDARLVTTALLFLIYAAYLSLRRSIDDPQVRARRSAILGVVAFVQVPIVHMSVQWWRTLHQPPTVLRMEGAPTIEASMFLALTLNVIAFTAVYTALLRRRMRLAVDEDEIERVSRDDAAPLAGAAVTQPRQVEVLGD
jgi:heme exporter protein C